jgi:hypothetical protein
MTSRYNSFLIVGAVLSSLASLLHIGCIIFGAPWYRFFGAGEQMARLADAGSITPTLITAGIAAVLFVWALYALSGARVISPMPLTRVALVAITGIYLVRGLAVLPVAMFMPAQNTAFLWWSSLICLGFGVVHAVGLRQVWGFDLARR